MSSHLKYNDIYDKLIVQPSKSIIFSFSPLDEKYVYRPFGHAIADDAVEKLGKLMRDNLPFYCFGEDEVTKAYESNTFSSLEDAIQYAYSFRLPHRDPKKDGLPGEVLLDLLVQIYNPDAYKLAVRMISRQDDGSEIKGYDLTYFTKDSSGLALWLGQAKLGEKRYCKDGINADLIEKYTNEYLTRQLYFVSTKRYEITEDAKILLEKINGLNVRTIRKDGDSRARALIDLLNEMGIVIKIPCLLAYDEKLVYENAAHLYEHIQREVDEIKSHFNNRQYSFVGFNPEIVFYVFPIESIKRLRDKENGFYAGLC